MQVGKGIAGIVATDGTVNDEGWLEIFQADSHDRLTVVQALGDPYRRALRDALAYPNEGDDDGGVIAIPSGELVLWSSALDGIDDVGTDLRGASHSVSRIGRAMRTLPGAPQYSQVTVDSSTYFSMTSSRNVSSSFVQVPPGSKAGGTPGTRAPRTSA